MNPQDPSRWLRTARPLAAPRLRLLCFPYAGGGATIFHRWSHQLPADVEVRAVQLPARQDRFTEPPLRRMQAIVDHVLGALAQLPPTPEVLFGHSLGATVAFEVARRRQAMGTTPLGLVVGARAAPPVPAREPWLHVLDEEAFLAGLHARYATPWSTLRNAELMQLALPALRADMEVVETYVYAPGPPLAAPITVLRGLQDARVTEEDAAAWQALTRAPLRRDAIAAGHFFVDSHAEWVLGHVKEALAA